MLHTTIPAGAAAYVRQKQVSVDIIHTSTLNVSQLKTTPRQESDELDGSLLTVRPAHAQ